MKHIFVGDIHGKYEVVSKALDMDGHKVFVGDFLDSYDRNTDDMEKCLTLVIEALEKDDCTVILGNHELSYMDHQRWGCSGFSVETAEMFSHYKGKLVMMAVPFYIPTEDFLVTHAGLDNYYWTNYGFTLENLPERLDGFLSNTNHDLYGVGRCRGGSKNVGGIFWNDFLREHTPVPELHQVFGHTRVPEISVKGTSVCIDCLDSNDASFFEVDL